MQIQVNTDKNIEGHEALATEVKGIMGNTLEQYAEQITRLEVHISDENSQKGGADDKRCMIEARLKGRQPVAVTHHAATVDKAVSGAADKVKRALESTLGKLREHR